MSCAFENFSHTTKLLFYRSRRNSLRIYIGSGSPILRFWLSRSRGVDKEIKRKKREREREIFVKIREIARLEAGLDIRRLRTGSPVVIHIYPSLPLDFQIFIFSYRPPTNASAPSRFGGSAAVLVGRDATNYAVIP